jgi:hypothetical protein
MMADQEMAIFTQLLPKETMHTTSLIPTIWNKQDQNLATIINFRTEGREIMLMKYLLGEGPRPKEAI